MTTSVEAGRELLLTVTVHGRPAPQGSKKYAGHRRNAASGRISAVLVEQSKRVKPWRELVTAATAKAMRAHGQVEPFDGPLAAEIMFTVLKPPSAPKRRRIWPITRHSGDIDKLLRSSFDGITDAGAVVDDSRIVRVCTEKTFPEEQPGALDRPGAVIKLYRIN